MSRGGLEHDVNVLKELGHILFVSLYSIQNIFNIIFRVAREVGRSEISRKF